MLITIEGFYKNGQVQLLEQPENIEEAKVLVTLLNEKQALPCHKQQIAGLLADRIMLFKLR